MRMCLDFKSLKSRSVQELGFGQVGWLACSKEYNMRSHSVLRDLKYRLNTKSVCKSIWGSVFTLLGVLLGEDTGVHA